MKSDHVLNAVAIATGAIIMACVTVLTVLVTLTISIKFFCWTVGSCG